MARSKRSRKKSWLNPQRLVFLLAVLLAFGYMNSAQTQSVDPGPLATPTPTPTPYIGGGGGGTDPTTTPTPTVTPQITPISGTNLAPILGQWGNYHLYNNIYYGSISNPQIAFADFTNTHNENPSIRLGPRNNYNLYREVNFHWLPVSPGDHVVFRCWIKTEASTTNYKGGIIGFDVYGPIADYVNGVSDNGRLWEVSNCANGDDNDSFGDPKTWNYQYVSYGNDWTLMTVDVTIPDTVFTHNDYGKPKTPQQINGLIPWLGANWMKSDWTTLELSTVWFADAELYINP